MDKINQNVIDCDYEKKNPLLRFADFINRKSVYKIFHGRKVVFFKNSNDELDYSSKKYKCSYLAVLFFIVTMPLLPLTMAIKGLSSENKLRKKDIKAIDFGKKAKASFLKKAKIDARLRKTAELKKKLAEEKHLEEAKKRIASPLLGGRKSPPLSQPSSLRESSLSLSESSIDDESEAPDAPARQPSPPPIDIPNEELIIPTAQKDEDVESGDEVSVGDVKTTLTVPLPANDVVITINEVEDISEYGAKFEEENPSENQDVVNDQESHKDLESQEDLPRVPSSPARTVSQLWQEKQKIAYDWWQTSPKIAKLANKLGFGNKPIEF